MPGVQGVEYDGGSAVRTGIIRYGSRAVCGSGFADGGTGKRVGAQAKPVSLDEIELSDTDRTRTGFAELDRVLGSGVVRGSLVLVGGDPGIGKSTLLLQVCRNLAGQEQKVLYVSGEESLKQIKLRASRIGTVRGPLSFLSETNLDTIAEVIREVRPGCGRDRLDPDHVYRGGRFRTGLVSAR